MKQRKVDSMREVKFDVMRNPAIAVHEKSNDYPDKYVAEVFDMEELTGEIMIKDTLEELQKDIEENTDMMFFPRGTDDVKTLVGVWM